MSKDALGDLMVSLAVRDDGFNQLTSKGFQSWMLQDSETKKAWDYCLGLKAKGETPSLIEVAGRFSVDTDISPGDSLEAALRRIRDRSFCEDIKGHLEEAMDAVAHCNPDAALRVLLESSKLKGKYTPEEERRFYSYRKSYEERILSYWKLKASGGVLGPITRQDQHAAYR